MIFLWALTGVAVVAPVIAVDWWQSHRRMRHRTRTPHVPGVPE